VVGHLLARLPARCCQLLHSQLTTSFIFTLDLALMLLCLLPSPVNPSPHAGEDIVAASGKLEVLDRLLRRLQRRGHRVVLFSQFNMMLDVLEDYLNMRGCKWVTGAGSGGVV
jgi:SNF2 family DNA or RNA helicase